MLRWSQFSRYFKDSILTFGLVNLSSLFNYLFQLVVGRAMTPADFGIFNSLSSFSTVLLAPMAVLPVVISKFTTQLFKESKGCVSYLLKNGLKITILIGFFLVIIGCLAIEWIKGYLHIEDSSFIIVMLVGVALAFVFPVLLGVMQGLKRFEHFGLAISSAKITRFFGAIILVWYFSWGVLGALISNLIGSVFIIIFGCWVIRDFLKYPMEPFSETLFKDLAQYSVPVFFYTFSLMALCNLDIIFVRHFCSEEESGLYAIGAIIGRIAIFLPSPFTSVLFPTAVEENTEKQINPRSLWLTMVLTGFIAGGFALVCTLWPAHIITILFGVQYQGAAPLLQVLSFAMALLAVANVIFTYSLARSNFKFLWPLVISSILMCCLIYMFHDSALTIAWIVLGSTALTLIGSAWVYFRQMRPVFT